MAANSSKAMRGNRCRCEAGEQRLVSGQQAGLGFRDDALGEVEAAAGIQRNDEYAAQHAAEECRNPLRAVLSPQHHALAAADLAPHQLGGKALRQGCQIAVGGNLSAIAAMDDHGSLGAVTSVIVNERGQMKAHNGVKYAISLARSSGAELRSLTPGY